MKCRQMNYNRHLVLLVFLADRGDGVCFPFLSFFFLCFFHGEDSSIAGVVKWSGYQPNWKDWCYHKTMIEWLVHFGCNYPGSILNRRAGRLSFTYLGSFNRGGVYGDDTPHARTTSRRRPANVQTKHGKRQNKPSNSKRALDVLPSEYDPHDGHG